MSVFDWLFLALRSVVATVFITYGIRKLQDVVSFTATIRRYKFMPPKASFILARVIPPVEILLGALLLLNIFPLAAALALTALLAVFSGALLYNWYISKGLQRIAAVAATSQSRTRQR
jgi:uncharacterized membrane protein YphA (DoxX/SURF4 family)